jgi:PAS domain S-box-containing protein
MKPLIPTESVFRLIVDEVRDFAIFLLDLEGNIDTWNPGAERIFGWTGDEVIGRHFSVLFTPADR